MISKSIYTPSHKVRKYVIHSHKFAPAHYNSLLSIFQNRDFADHVAVNLSKDYFRFDSKLKVHRKKILFGSINVHLNSSIKTLLLIIVSKLFGKKNIIFLHEPIKDLKSKLSSYPGFKSKLKLIIVKYINDQICRWSDKILVFSENSYRNTPTKFLGKVQQLSLPFVDQFVDSGCELTDPQLRVVISYIGTVAYDHGFDNFVNWIKESQLDRNIVEFYIYTKSQISERVLQELDEKCVVNSGRLLTNKEINLAYKKSTFCWCVYRSASQSGVLPMALMNKSIPLVSRAFGADLRKYEDCSLLIEDVSSNELDYIIKNALGSLYTLRDNARDAFCCNHDARKFDWRRICDV